MIIESLLSSGGKIDMHGLFSSLHLTDYPKASQPYKPIGTLQQEMQTQSFTRRHEKAETLSCMRPYTFRSKIFACIAEAGQIFYVDTYYPLYHFFQC